MGNVLDPSRQQQVVAPSTTSSEEPPLSNFNSQWTSPEALREKV